MKYILVHNIFDALIGNLDRHDQNWGFLSNQERTHYQFSPLYDNGRSFRGDLTQKGKKATDKSVEFFLRHKEFIEKSLVSNANAKHKMLLRMSGKNMNLNHYEFIKQFLKDYTIDTKFIFDHRIDGIINKLSFFKIESFFEKIPNVRLGDFSLTSERIKFMKYLTEKRLIQLNKVLGNLL